MAEPSIRARRRSVRRRRVIASAAGIVVVLGGGAVAIAATSGNGTSRRVATAALASVTQTIESSGTIASSEKSAAAFAVPGTVKGVTAKVGDTVHKGQVLATLETTSLQSTVDSDQTALAKAKQQLEADKTGQTSTSSGGGESGGGTSSGTSSGAGGSETGTSLQATPSAYTFSRTDEFTATMASATTGKKSSGDDLAGLIKKIEAAQTAVITGQKKVDLEQTAIDAAQKIVNADIAQNTKLRDAQQTACAAGTSADGSAAGNQIAANDPAPTDPAPTDPATVGTSAPATTTPPTSTTAPSTTAPPTTAPPTTAPPTTAPPGQSAECLSAMANYQVFADTMSTDTGILSGRITIQDGDLTALRTAMNSLDQLVGQLPSAAAKTGTGMSGGNSGSGGSGSGGSGATKSKGGGNTGQGGNSGTSKQRTGQSGTSKNGAGQSGTSNRSTSQNGKFGNSGASKNGSTGPGNSSTGGSGNSSQPKTTEPASASQLAADQAAIDAAQANLGVDQQKLTAATLTSPMTGTVAVVGFTAGTASSGQSITIVGTGPQQADVAVPLGEIDVVKVGQSATITADGVSEKIHGTVRSIGLLSSTSGSSTTFPVTITLDPGSPALFDGSGADVAISSASAKNVLTVPNSAIHTVGNGRYTVTVLHGDTTSTVLVTVGVAGSDRTQIKTGLKAGEQVVLADFSEQLPSTSTSGSTSRFPGEAGRANFGGGARAGG